MFLREPSHILILLLVVLVLFGAKRLPDSARSLGKSMRIFKSELKEMKQEDMINIKKLQSIKISLIKNNVLIIL